MSVVKKLKEVFADRDPALTGWDDFTAQSTAPDWVKALHVRTQEEYAARGIPTPKSERYKYTNINAAVKNLDLSFETADIVANGTTELAQRLPDALKNAPDWVKAMAMDIPAGDPQYQDMSLWLAADAFMRDGIVLDIPKNTNNKTPLDISLLGHDGAYTVPRTFIRLQENAEFTIIERHTGEGAYWNNAVTQIHVGKGARLRHYRLQDNDKAAVYTQNTHVTIDRDGAYEAFVLTAGSSLSRNQIHVDLKGENAEARLAGVNLLNDMQHGDTTITIEHQAPNCRSNQTYKSIIADKAHGVFQGKVHVHQIAQKTDGYQLSNTLLISPTAQMDTKPELEIYADDVKCSHGSTTGQMDTAPLFYLRTRGLSEAQAKMLLMQAFLGPALDEIRDDDAREIFTQKATEWLVAQSEK